MNAQKSYFYPSFDPNCWDITPKYHHIMSLLWKTQAAVCQHIILHFSEYYMRLWTAEPTNTSIAQVWYHLSMY
jgi:hypothetical protein